VRIRNAYSLTTMHVASMAILLVCLALGLLAGCSGDPRQQSNSELRITSLSRDSGPVGAVVIITGEGFGATQGSSRVSFGGTTTVPKNWSNSSISAPVPQGATTGNVVVTVGGAASNGVTFTVTTQAPSITSLNPVSGPIGTPVTVTGINFGTTQGTSTITFNGTVASPSSWTPTSILAKAPFGAATGNVVVTVGGAASNGVLFTITSGTSTLQSITISPNPANVAAGSNVQLTASGHFSDGSTQDVTTQCAWSSGTASLASVGSHTGLVSGMSFGGPVAITAADGVITATASLNVTGSDTTASTGSMPEGRILHTATLLNNGKVLIAGGSEASGGKAINSLIAQALLFDPSTQQFESTGDMVTPRAFPTVVLLQNGMVLILGGGTASDQAVAQAEIYDPSSGTFSATGSMLIARGGFTATLLNSGEVLIAGGSGSQNSVSTYLAEAELYDPVSGQFSTTGNMTTPRSLHTATLLDDGTVLLAGGEDGDDSPLSSAEIYDPATGTFTATGSMAAKRILHIATPLNNGKVLIAGGVDNSKSDQTALASAEIYDVATKTFTTTGSMTTARTTEISGAPSITLLSDGTAFVAGGVAGDASTGPQILASTEIYDPASGTFTASADMTTPRFLQTATLLDNGGVLLAGGTASLATDDSGILSSAEIFEPSELTPAHLVSIALTPASATIKTGSSQVYVALGTFSDNSTQVLASVIWTSSSSAASISNDATNKGCAFGAAAGTATITATAGTVSGSATLTIQ
jgi:hypothetical protein